MRRGIFSGSERVVGFSGVEEVVLEQSQLKFEPDDRPNPIYRVVFVLKSGERIPLTPHLDAERKSKARAIQLIQKFMGQEYSVPVEP